MKVLSSLPSNYNEIFSVNLQKDKKKAVIVNVLSVAIFIIMFVPMAVAVPLTTIFEADGEMWTILLRPLCMLLLLPVYLVLHELTHGVAMKAFGSRKVKYGFTGLYAFAGSDDYYPKTAYIIIALAPVVLWGVVLAVINFIVPYQWIWVIYLVQIINISGAAGDFYVTFKFIKMPSDILVCDSGVGMTVYSAHTNS